MKRLFSVRNGTVIASKVIIVVDQRSAEGHTKVLAKSH